MDDKMAQQGQEQAWHLKEYERLSSEINHRVAVLHNSINFAIIFWMVGLVAFFSFMACGVSDDNLKSFVLLFPIITDLLGFNYQSNQNSLESIARYFNDVVQPRLIETFGHNSILNWEKYFAEQKKPFMFESVYKVFPFVLPSVIPIVFLAKRIPMTSFHFTLVIFDIILLLFLLENFRYKLRRVK